MLGITKSCDRTEEKGMVELFNLGLVLLALIVMYCSLIALSFVLVEETV